MLKEALKGVQRAAHCTTFTSAFLRALLTIFSTHMGKSARFSQAALSAMHIDVGTSRFLDIVPPPATRALKDRKSNNKENISRPISSASIKKSDPKSDFVMVGSSDFEES